MIWMMVLCIFFGIYLSSSRLKVGEILVFNGARSMNSLVQKVA
uniref:Uncharacterized protein n=1 Tax=Rhizophora mucronata TaxID=61149 RepID=A0A2P2LR40_RHIMU